ncbi:hypothetical protein UCRPC4_g00615 [Phaeomoniella chlamydospora]|uniref:Uncharacterized protein n=1 Tax=Phaeomoniella chlamydospora TaxID=158046 RepID=A0A0G2F0V4_PHACM|nr:hypothetical protein UCRPC4_g00615 [Phaeomoniella chlamydospora]
MPIRWGPAEDQTLLLLILEVHESLNLRVESIAANWPITEGQQKPTPRAIREHLVKLRDSARKSGNGGNFSIGKARGPKPTTSTNSNPTTPKKRRTIPAQVKSEVKSEQIGDVALNSFSSTCASPTGGSGLPTPSSTKSVRKANPMSRKRPFEEVDTFDGKSDEENDSYFRTDKVETRGNRVNIYESDGTRIDLMPQYDGPASGAYDWTDRSHGKLVPGYNSRPRYDLSLC